MKTCYCVIIAIVYRGSVWSLIAFRLNYKLQFAFLLNAERSGEFRLGKFLGLGSWRVVDVLMGEH